MDIAMLPRLLPATLFFAFSALSMPTLADERTPTIHISAQGAATAAPDMAIVTSGVVAEGTTAREALTANNEAMNALIAVLKAAGIEDKHIQTSNFSVQPNYVHSDKRDANGYPLPPKIDGYRVSNMVTVKVLDLDSLGAVLDQSVTVGANTINGIDFGVQDASKLLDEARKNAMAEAIKNASIYAEAANVSLGSILSITETTNYNPQPYAGRAKMDMVMAEAAPVMGGEVDYSITVDVQWEIKN